MLKKKKKLFLAPKGLNFEEEKKKNRVVLFLVPKGLDFEDEKKKKNRVGPFRMILNTSL